MAESASPSEAHEMIKKAESLLTPKKWFIFGSSPDYLEAAELYNRAAIILKGCKEWKEAGDAFKRSAQIESQGGETDESARKLLNAASCYKKCDPALAIGIIEQALEVLLRAGRFSLAASHEKEIAELYETQLDDPLKAIIFYERAAERYAGEDSTALAQGCSLKAASLLAMVGEYEKAARTFEEAASQSASDPVRKYTVKDMMFRAGLCRLGGEDRIAARRAIETYPATIEISFGQSKEYALLNDILGALEHEDVEAFTEAISTFDRTNPIDDWKTKILLKIKESFGEEQSLT